MPKSIHFKVVFWKYKPNISENGVKTFSTFGCSKLLSNETKDVPQGLVFNWLCEVKNKKEIKLDYKSEEFYLIEKDITETDLNVIVFKSYIKSKEELEKRNIAAGFNATMKPYNEFDVGLSKLVRLLQG